jgi:hypothetical protein
MKIEAQVRFDDTETNVRSKQPLIQNQGCEIIDSTLTLDLLTMPA